MTDVDTAELNAIRIEISEAIKRRMSDDPRLAAETFTVTSMAVAEVLADLIYGAATDAAHAQRLVVIMIGVMSNRIRHREKTG
jgi:hypothetical protein